MNNSDKKRCGIITYHFAVNYGAVLQSYALRASLNNSGMDTHVINYVTNTQRNNNSLYRKGNGLKGGIKNAFLLPFHFQRSKRQSRFQNFVNENILGEKTDVISDLVALKVNVDSNYDCIISGSDQVFNPKIIDFNNAFFYPFKTEAKKIGYAVSSGGATVQELLVFKDYIDDFDVITARENTTIEVLSKITDKNVVEVCDPVFLLKKEDWSKIATSVKVHDYLLCYFVKFTDIDKKIKLAERIAKEKGLKLLILSARITKYNFTHTVISDAGPIEFVSYFANADYICTDSFHGTSFSLIFNKPFTTIEKREESADGRKTNILRKANALNSVYYLGDVWNEPEALDYEEVNRRLEEIRNESMYVLLEVIRI